MTTTAAATTMAVSPHRGPGTGTRRHALLVAGVLCIGLTQPLAARQLAFEHQRDTHVHRFSYSFETARGATAQVRFELPPAQIRASRNAFRKFDARDLDRRWRKRRQSLLRAELEGLRKRFPHARLSLQRDGTIEYAIAMQAQNRNLKRQQDAELATRLQSLRQRYPHTRIVYRPATGRIEVRGARSQKELKRLNRALSDIIRRTERDARQRSAVVKRSADASLGDVSRKLARAVDDVYASLEAFRATYLHERYYRETRPGVLVPDYPRIAEESAERLDALAQAWSPQVASQSQRAVVDELLGFFQSIPYDTLQSRGTSNGAGFATPTALIARNRGDCDTKSVAMAALLNRLYPDLPIVMVLLRNHALLAAALPVQRGDRTMRHQGRRYVLLEPVGPALTPAGQTGTQSKRRIEHVLTLF